jgi:hypothetical protein
VKKDPDPVSPVSQSNPAARFICPASSAFETAAAA